MVETVTKQFEHYLAWTVGAVVELVNSRLTNAAAEPRLCPELGGYIRYGVNTTHALLLMTSGIRSRRLAHAVVADLPDGQQAAREALRAWLAGMSISDWRARYDASPAEVLDLLEFTRVRSRSLLKTLLETGTVTVNLPAVAETSPTPGPRLTLGPLHGEPTPEPLAVFADHQLMAVISSQDHVDVRAILDTGLDLALDIDRRSDPPALRITLPIGDD